MSVSFNDEIPLDLWAYKIIPSISDMRTFHAIACTATWASAVIRNIAKNLSDINFKGEPYSFVCDGNTRVRTCIIQIFKIRVLNNHPELLTGLKNTQAAMAKTRPQDPVNIECLYRYSRDKNTMVDHINFVATILPFDFETQVINPGHLTMIVIKALEDKKIDLAQLALAHPQSKNLLAGDIADVLVEASRPNCLEIADILFSLPKAAEMPGFQPSLHSSSLLVAFGSAVSRGNTKLVLKLASHPNAADIPDSPGLTYLRSALDDALKSKNPRLIAAVLHHPRIVELEEKDLYKAGIAMLSEEDIEPLVGLQDMHEKDFERKELAKTFINLTARTQRFFYLMLCNMHGCPWGDIVKTGMVHFVKHPESLLTIINNLAKTPKLS